MKKLVLLSLVSLMTTFLWATEPGMAKRQKPVANPSGMRATAPSSNRNNKPKSLRASSLQKVVVGRAGNLLSVLNANCHSLDVDSALNTVVFIHRSDTALNNTTYNVAQYRYDISKNGGNTWAVNIGPLNPTADNITINGRYPQAVIYKDSAYPNIVDSTFLVYNGTWHNGGSPISVWQGQYYGVGQLSGNPASFTEHHDIVNNANVEIATSLIQSIPGHFWNINMDYTQTTTTTDTIRGIIIEKGLWNDSAGEVLWSYQPVAIGSAVIADASGAPVGNNLGEPTISFDPTGRYGWIVLNGDMTNDANFSTRLIYLNTSDYGQTWSTPTELALENLPGMFPEDPSATDGGKTVLNAQVTVDADGNPHIAAVVAQNDTTSDQYTFYIFQQKVLYDIYYNPTVPGCSWQANYISAVHGYSAYYTSDNLGDGNRVQMSRTKDGKKIFIFWTDTDSSIVAAITDVNNTNPNPNLFGIGIDMGTRKVTNIKDFTAGDPLFGGQIPSQSLANGTLGGALFPMISPNVLNQAGANYNIPAILTEPDYLNGNTATKSSENAARFYYCQNIDFAQSDFVNKFDNAPPTLTVGGGDTAFVLLGNAYTPPTATAFDCATGSITPQYTSTVPTNVSGLTDSVGIYMSTWTATGSSGNTATHTQVVIVAAIPIARLYYTSPSCGRYLFTDSSLNFPTTRTWTWGDGTSDNLNQVHATKVYTSKGTKMVVLKVTNSYGSSSDTTYVTVSCLAGLNDPSLAEKISVYPNPSTGFITVDMADEVAHGAKVSVYNMLGAQTGEAIEIKDNTAKTVLNLSGLESGVYLMKIETPSGTAVKQIAINK